jgi:mRNA interferase HigB
MRVLALRTIKDFWGDYPDSEQSLKAWYAVATKANWENPQDVKRAYGNASILQNGRVVFNIAGNKYRLIAKISYPYHTIYIRFIGTHGQYDKIDAQMI